MHKSVKELAKLAREINREAGLAVYPEHIRLEGRIDIKALIKEMKEIVEELTYWSENIKIREIKGFGDQWIPVWSKEVMDELQS